MRQSSREVSDSTQRQKWWIKVVQQRTDNRGQMPQMQFQRVQKKSEILSIRPPELGTSNVFSTRSERSSFPRRSRRQWRCRRKPNTANVRRSCRSEGDQQSNQIATVLNNIHQFKIPAHRFNRGRSAQEINKHVSDDVRAENKPKTAKTKEAKKRSW